jgi:hypothetical protein
LTKELTVVNQCPTIHVNDIKESIFICMEIYLPYLRIKVKQKNWSSQYEIKKRQAALLNAPGKSFHSGHPVTEHKKKSAK